MYGVSSAFNIAAEANTRKILVKALFNDSILLSGDNLINMTVTEAVAASGGISLGTTIAAQLTLAFKMPETPIVLSGGWVEPSVGFQGIDEYCPLGKFYISKIESAGNKYTITAYDAFSKTEAKYVPTISMPNTAGTILADIAEQCGFSLGQDHYEFSDGVLASQNPPDVNENGILIFANNPDVNDTGTLLLNNMQYPEGLFDLYDFTCRQYIGYFAGLLGKNAKFDRTGKLSFAWYANIGRQVTNDLQYLGGFKRSTDKDYTVHSITAVGESTITSGSGVGFSFENPFMTQEVLDSIQSAIGEPSFTPATVKWRGNPAIEAGDIITASDKNGELHDIYIMEQTLHIGGGLHSEIKCYGATEEEIQFDTSPTSKKIQAVYTKLQAAIVEATKLLSGSEGGIFEVIDDDGDGVNDGWIIHTVDEKQHIKANVNGIGITTDGGGTYKEAITTEGINASTITVGTLNAERIAVENFDAEDPTKITDYIRFGDGTITLGKGSNSIILKLENDKIAFYDANGVRKAIFTNNSFEIENLEEGKIRFQNFGYITRASGNLSFTKLI